MSRYAAIKRDPRIRKRKDGTRRRPKYLHISAALIHTHDAGTGLRKTLVAKGKTFRVGSTGLEKFLANFSGRQRVKNRKAIARAKREAA